MVLSYLGDFMRLFNTIQSAMLASAMLLPTYAMAEDLSSTLTNQSTQNGSTGFYLVQDKIIGENDCVKVEGNAKLNPNDSAQLKIKQGCKWGVVRYKIFDISSHKDMGYLKHSFNDGNFNIDITSICKSGECNFYGLNPEQNKPK